jgi:peptide/nickel transport system substrate-binding protein
MTVFALVLIASMVLSACGTPATPAPTAEAATAAPAQPTAAPAPTDVPTAAPTVVPTAVPVTRKGGWLDEIDYSIVDAQSVITQIGAGAVDLFSYGLASDKLAEIKTAKLCYTQSYGTYYDFLFNPAVFTDKAVLNPFSNRKIREAMNWAIDRNYINQEIYAGGALPKFTPLTTQLVDYTGVIDVARGLEAYYAYNLDKAKAVVDTEMVAMGAAKGADGKWTFGGKPLTLIFLIRNDGDGTRKPQGEYFAQQLEALGFTVDRQEKKSSELSPLWIGSDPKAGKWSLYTAGWGSSGLNRDEKTTFSDMYLPDSAQGIPLFTQNVPDPAFLKVGDDLKNGNFTSLQERHDMFAKALPLALQDSLQVWTVDLQTYAPFNCKLQVSSDVGAGVETTKMAPFNLRIKGQEGGQVKSATTATLFTDPWNPVLGANWVTSAFVQAAVSSGAFMPDPYTGLSHPFRAESAEVTAQTGLPIATNLDWVKLTTADKIDVPADAWSDWNAKTQKFITAGEKFPKGTTAKVKIVIHYPADMFKTVKWHDGSNLSPADFVMAMIMSFDQGKKDSPIYDEDAAANIDAYLTHFKGVQIVSADPLTIAIYDDNYYADAELDASAVPATGLIWPQYGFGESPWQTIAIGNAADAAKELAWGTGKADRNKVEWTSFIGGPSLATLAKELDAAIAAKTVPYAPTLGAYITADEAVARYTALKTWYTARGHFWDGTGPYFLSSVDLNAGSAVVKNNPAYADLADRWSSFGVAPLAEAALDGPAQVKIGAEAVFNVTLTAKDGGAAYKSADVKEVKFLLYDDKGATVYVGAGKAGTEDGKFTLTIPADVAAKLVAGSGRIEAAAVLIPVAIPAFTSMDYVVVP